MNRDRIDPAKNPLYITLNGCLADEEVKTAADQIMEGIDQLNKSHAKAGDGVLEMAGLAEADRYLSNHIWLFV